MLEKINHEQRLYVLKCDGGFTCLGFDVAYTKAKAMVKWANTMCPTANIAPPLECDIGTEEGYKDYATILYKVGEYCRDNGLRCPVELCPQLVGLEGRRVEVVDEYGEKRRFKVGRSTGWCPVHLELANARSTGGGAVYGFPFQSVRVIK